MKEEPDCIYFDMQSGFAGIDEDIQKIDERLHGKFIRISQGEKEEIHKWYIEQVYKKFIYIVKAAVERTEGGQEDRSILWRIYGWSGTCWQNIVE